jgi:hypothetical protein
MTDEDRTEQDDLESQEGQPLPDREVMSIITPEPQPLPAAESGASNEPLRGGEPL